MDTCSASFATASGGARALGGASDEYENSSNDSPAPSSAPSSPASDFPDEVTFPGSAAPGAGPLVGLRVEGLGVRVEGQGSGIQGL